MKSKEYLEWAKEVPFLAALPKKNPFLTPKDYFEDAHAHLKSLSVLHSANTQLSGGFSVPNGYFEELGQQISATIQLEQLKSNDNGFSVPEGYFDSLAARIEQKVQPTAKPQVKILRLWNSDMMRYASAACVILVTAAALFFNQQHAKIDTASTADLYSDQLLYDIDEQLIVESLQEQITSSKSLRDKNTDIEEYLIDNYTTSDLSQEF